MGSSFVVTLKSLVRAPSVIIWVLAFPIIMSTIFLFMFSGMRTDGVADPISVALVEAADEKDGAAEALDFAEVLEALSADGDDQLLDLRLVETSAEAANLLAAGEIEGYYEVSADGAPDLTVADTGSVGAAVLDAVASSYVQSGALMAEVAERDPATLNDPAAVASALGLSAGVERAQVTHATPDEIVRYYYALLGMATLMATQAGMLAVASAQPCVSELGARRAVAGTPRGRQLVGCVAGAWVVSFAALALAFAFLLLVVGVDFAGREGLCLVGVGACSLLATAIGAFVGALPIRADLSARSGIMTGLTCLLSLFAGLYGTAALELSDWLARTAPWTAWVNPTKLVCDTFYSLYFYTSLAPFALRVAVCVAASLVLLVLATAVFRRQSYEHL